MDGCNLEPTGLESEESGSLDRLKEDESDRETGIGAAVLSIQEEVENGFHGLDSSSAVEAEAQDSHEDFLSLQLILNSQSVFSNRQVEMETEDDGEALTVWPQAPGESENWWRIPDFIHEVLPLPKNFDLQLGVSSVLLF